MEAYIPHEIDLETKATQEEKVEFMMFLLHNIYRNIPRSDVDKVPEEMKKFFKIANHEGSAKEVN